MNPKGGGYGVETERSGAEAPRLALYRDCANPVAGGIGCAFDDSTDLKYNGGNVPNRTPALPVLQ